MQITVRQVKKEDASAIAEIRAQETVAANTLSLPLVNALKSQQFVERALTEDNIIQLVAESDGVLVGVCGLFITANPKMNHTGTIGIMVHEDYHHKGVGNALMTHIIKLSDDWLMLNRLELGVLACNPNAKALYEKHGFVVEGIKKMVVRRYGKFEDEIMMARYKNFE